MKRQHLVLVIGTLAVAGVVLVAQGAPPPAGQARVVGTPIPGSAEPPKLIFHEPWTRAPLSQPITQENLANQALTLHVYGDATQIRKAMHPLDDYTYTGETTTNWALTGTPMSGGGISTAGNLVFIGATIDGYFRAFDARNGKELWRDKLPAPSQGIPSTYLGKDGKQYVVVGANGGGFFRAPTSDEIIAYVVK